MSRQTKERKTITQAIALVIANHPQRQASLDEIYREVNRMLNRQVNTAVVRGCINRALPKKATGAVTRYKPLFQRVAPATYALAED